MMSNGYQVRFESDVSHCDTVFAASPSKAITAFLSFTYGDDQEGLHAALPLTLWVEDEDGSGASYSVTGELLSSLVIQKVNQ
jgi:hypothetical protein